VLSKKQQTYSKEERAKKRSPGGLEM